jgi:hypothetical protein
MAIRWASVLALANAMLAWAGSKQNKVTAIAQRSKNAVFEMLLRSTGLAFLLLPYNSNLLGASADHIEQDLEFFGVPDVSSNALTPIS